MTLAKFTASMVFAFASTIGCNSYTPTAPNNDVQPEGFGGESPTTKEDSQPPQVLNTPSDASESKANAGKIESAALKQAMIDVATLTMKLQDPNTETNAVERQVESAITQIRKEVPEFLMVSAETEQQLLAGKAIESAAKRIAEAETFLSDSGVEFSGLVRSLLPEHKAGNLSPLRTELLAQLITADMKKIESALMN